MSIHIHMDISSMRIHNLFNDTQPHHMNISLRPVPLIEILADQRWNSDVYKRQGGLVDPGYDVHQRAFPRTILAHHRVYGSLFDLQTDILVGRKRAVILTYIF